MASFATVEDLATYIQPTNPPEFSAADSATAQLLLDIATTRIQTATRQTLEAVAGDAITIRPLPGVSVIRLPQRPVTAISSMVNDGVTLTVETDYTFDGLGFLRRVNGTWGRKVDVTYDHGYATIPWDLKAACLELARRGMGLKREGVLRSETMGNYSAGYASADDTRVLAPVDPDAVITSYQGVLIG